MKKYFFLILLFCSGLSFLTVQACTRRKTKINRCCRFGAGGIAYKLASLCIYNDYHNLVLNDSLWLLQKKMALAENLSDLDKYYLSGERAVYMLDGSKTVSFMVYATPLHCAIMQGNFAIVRLLCKAGTDKTKRVKSTYEDKILSKDIGKDIGSVTHYTPVVSKELFTIAVSQALKERYVGCSGTELAKRCMEELTPSELNKQQQRKAIYDFLMSS